MAVVWHVGVNAERGNWSLVRHHVGFATSHSLATLNHNPYRGRLFQHFDAFTSVS